MRRYNTQQQRNKCSLISLIIMIIFFNLWLDSNKSLINKNHAVHWKGKIQYFNLHENIFQLQYYKTIINNLIEIHVMRVFL